jgi:O-antigen/teichoic acid export membrane protein
MVQVTTRNAVDSTFSRFLLLEGAIWTTLAFGVNQLFRLATSVILARLLAPDLFGIMQIVYSLRTGVELVSDVGIGQNIIYNKHGNDPDFYDTAWSLQVIRSVLLWFIFSVAAVPAAAFYDAPILVAIIPIAGFAIVLGGLSSTSRFLLQKRMKYSTLTLFDAVVSSISSAAQIIWAYLSPTIWALVFAPLVGVAALMIGSHLLLPEVRQKFRISRQYVAQILSFGKWIFMSSIIYFLSTNFDRLYFAKVIPLNLLGVYGIARAMSELFSAVVLQLGNSVIFPFVAAHSHVPRAELQSQVAPSRMRFLLIAGFGLSLFASNADLVIRMLYDQRYRDAGWMLPILVIGAWFSTLANINESTLLGIGRPSYGALANAGKFAFLVVGIVWGVAWYGVFGGVIVVALGDLCRYFPILAGQRREQLSFATQDALATLAVFGQILFWEWLRSISGFGTSFDGLPVDLFAMARWAG